MRCPALFASCLAFVAVSAAAAPQADLPTLSPAVQQITCAPRTLARNDGGAPRVIGARDRLSNGTFAPREVIVISTGDASPVTAGQLYVAYRRPRTHPWKSENEQIEDVVQNVGVIRVDGVTGDRATATIVWACEGVEGGDRLAPFVPTEGSPAATGAFAAPGGVATASPEGAARVQIGEQDRRIGSARDFMMVNRVAGQDVRPGQRVAFFRQYQGEDGPATLIGEGVVQTVGERDYVVLIVGSRDAVTSGDFVGTASR